MKEQEEGHDLLEQTQQNHTTQGSDKPTQSNDDVLDRLADKVRPFQRLKHYKKACRL
jgi:hypothetical protein